MRSRRRGDPFGCHRVLEPPGSLPFAATRLNNELILWDNEVLVDVTGILLPERVFDGLFAQANGATEVLGLLVFHMVNSHGKLQDPDTGYGGNLFGRVKAVGSALAGSVLAIGDSVMSLISSAAIPLQIRVVLSGDPAKRLLRVRGDAMVLGTRGLVRLPPHWDIEEIAPVLQAAGAAACARRMAHPRDRLVVLGAGPAGLLSTYSALETVGPEGMVVLVDTDRRHCDLLRDARIPVDVVHVDSFHPGLELREIQGVTGFREFDVAIDCTADPAGALMAACLTKSDGTLVLHSYRTDLGRLAEGIGSLDKELTVAIATNPTTGDGELVVALLDRHPTLRKLLSQALGSGL